MAKKILLPLASAFLVVQSYKLLVGIHQLEIKSIFVLIFLAWIINMFITGIFAFVGFAYPTQRLLPASYYHIHQPSRLHKVYQFLKVEWFRKFLLATLWKDKKQRKRYFNGKKEGMDNLEEQSMKSEFGHLLPFIILLVVSVYLLAVGQTYLALFVLLWNILGNFYPILLQRKHRARLQAIKQRFQSR